MLPVFVSISNLKKFVSCRCVSRKTWRHVHPSHMNHAINPIKSMLSFKIENVGLPAFVSTSNLKIFVSCVSRKRGGKEMCTPFQCESHYKSQFGSGKP